MSEGLAGLLAAGGDAAGDERRLVAGLAAQMEARLRERAGADLDALGAGGPDSAALAGIRRHYLAVAWELLGAHIGDQRRIWRATRRGGWAPSAEGEFASHMANGGWHSLIARLPGLEPRVLAIADLEVEAAAALLRRAASDTAAIGERFAGGGDPGPLTGLELGLSDPHNGRRTVASVRFETAGLVIHKPRPVAMEAGFAAIAAWLLDRGLADPPAAVGVLVRDGYGWCEFVATAPCARAGEVGEYFRRLGALTAVLAALAATDCHAENFIARGAEPVLVDAETLLHPRTTASPELTATETEILPSRVRGPAGQQIDYAGFDAGPPGGPRPQLPAWDGAAHRLADNRPSFDASFEDARRALAGLGAELASPEGPLAALGGERSRAVLRPTSFYGALLGHLGSASSLAAEDGGLGRVRLELERYRDPALDDSAWDAVQRAELAAFSLGDVPYFMVGVASGDLSSADGTMLAKGALEPVIARVPAAAPLS